MSSPVNAPAPANPHLVIRKIAEAITIFSVPFKRGGKVPFGGRSTAVVLKNNKTFLIPSHPLDSATLETLSALPAPVTYLVSPDLEHDLYLPQYVAAFPNAKVYVPKPIFDKWSSDDKWKAEKERVTFVFGEGKGDPFETETDGEIKSVDFGASFRNQDIAFLHTPTKTLIEADLLFNLPAKEQFSKTEDSPNMTLVTGWLQPGTTMHKRMFWYLLCKDRQGMATAAKAVSDWDFDRVIPCHGDVIETGGKKAWNDTYEWFLNGKN
ncbi:hypothetical protein T439DRAFT_326896 [Meredithblackwellia eburnea MCA 4105]